MYLYNELVRRVDRPIQVGLIGAGKFGSMFLNQVPTTAGIEVVAITDLDPERARQACRNVGWSVEHIARTRYFEDCLTMIDVGNIDVLVEATGNPLAGVTHAKMAIEKRIHIVMVNVEADVLAGGILADEARAAGIVYSMAYGDQPALTIELVEWARSTGFKVVAAGKGTKYMPEYHYSTPDTVWSYYGLSAEEAAAAGMNSRMFNSFLDGTKSALEMAAISNGTGLKAPDEGLAFPAAGMDNLAHILRPRSVGGCLEESGMVEVVTSVERDGRPVYRDLRWGVYVVIEAPNSYAADCFRQYGMNTDETGRYSAMYKPFHLIGLELNISILTAALLGQATGSTLSFNSDVVATAKCDLKAGEILDGEGGFTVFGKLMSAEKSIKLGGLPIGLANNVVLQNDVKKDHFLTWSDVDIDMKLQAVSVRKTMEKRKVMAALS